MQQAIVLPFTELPVTVSERPDPDPTCLVKINGEKQTVVGRKSIHRKSVKIHTEEGWKDGCPQVVPVLEVVKRE